MVDQYAHCRTLQCPHCILETTDHRVTHQSIAPEVHVPRLFGGTELPTLCVLSLDYRSTIVRCMVPEESSTVSTYYPPQQISGKKIQIFSFFLKPQLGDHVLDV